LAATGASFAQSTATLYGVVDTGYRSVTSGTNKFSGMANGSNASNRLGFKGTEDLGGGLSAGFVMEGDLTPNDGTAGNFKFLRQSTVGITGGFGEVRLGRDYTPAFRVFGIVDPFGTVGVGSAGNIMWSTVAALGPIAAVDAANDAGTFVTPNRGTLSTSTPAANAAAILPASYTVADPSLVRANNSFAYYSPNFSGFKASLMYSTGLQNTASQKKQGAMTGLSLNYTNGPLVVAFANQDTKGGDAGAVGTTGTPATDDQKLATNFLAASYDLGMVKLGLGNRTEKLTIAGVPAAIKSNSNIYSLTAPVGAFTLKASYITKKATLDVMALSGSVKAGNQFAMGAVYDLSKRTAVYATYAQIKNEVGFANSVGSAAASAGGVKSKGFDVGVRHAF
jgi:predicted porin